MYKHIQQRFLSTRSHTENICKPLLMEDYSVQPHPDVSPPKWHLAHSTWFFEQFVLKEYALGYIVYSDDFAYLFNSYYNNAGERVLRPNRGLMTRPSVDEVYNYRHYVTKAVGKLLNENPTDELLLLIEIGINHEQQHQELLVYDIKYILGNQPTFPVYEGNFVQEKESQPEEWININEGVYTIGHQNDSFSFDNELGVHKVYLHDVKISSKLVTNGEFIKFIEAGGYQNFNLWHAAGWDFINESGIDSPMYWHKKDGKWWYYDFTGLVEVNPDFPVMHISFYEAFAFAEWKGIRLPTEFEWEIVADKLQWGQVWEWTGSAYLPYPNFTKAPGALGEYNGKFMVGLHVLRGGSIGTPSGHSRKTYRNFFHPSSRWQFGGLRLAQ